MYAGLVGGVLWHSSDVPCRQTSISCAYYNVILDDILGEGRRTATLETV